METYTATTLVNGQPRAVLIYKADAPITFPHPGSHTICRDLGDATIVEAYRCEPYIYREITPEESDSGPFYFYWFLITGMDSTTVINNQSQINDLKSRQEAAESAILGLMQMQLNQPM